MKNIISLLENWNVILILSGIAMTIIGLVGKIQTQWVTIELGTVIERIISAVVGFIFAYIGMIRSPYKFSQTTKKLLLSDEGRFEWQFAGQNWKGTALFRETDNKNVAMTLNVKKSFITGQTGENISLLEGPAVIETVTNGEGKVKTSKDSISLTDLRIKRSLFNLVDIGNGYKVEGVDISSTNNEFLSAHSLRLVPAFAGKAVYKDVDSGIERTGDLILVKYEQRVYH